MAGDQLVELRQVGVDAAHELLGELVGLEHLDVDRGGGGDALRVRLVEQVQRSLASVGPLIGAFHHDAGDVVAAARVDLDAVADLDEQRHLDDLAGLERGRLAGARHAVTLHAGLGLGDLELDRGRDLDRDDLALEERDLGGHALDHVVGGVAERDRRHVHLLVRVVVHEHVVVAVAVEELHLLAVDDRLLDPDAGVEGAVEDVAVLQVAQLGAHERAALAGLDVLELDDLEQAVVELERDPGLQVVGGDGRHGVSLGNRVRIRQPVSVTSTRSSMRKPPNPTR